MWDNYSHFTNTVIETWKGHAAIERKSRDLRLNLLPTTKSNYLTCEPF